MAITRFALGNLDAAGRDALESIPGVKANGVTAAVPTNCTWLALELGLHEVAGPERLDSRTAKLALPWLRPWIPEFLTAYQREGVLTALASPGESHLFVWSAGSGKTLGALVWSLAAGIGLTVVCTKSGIRPTWAREIESYTAGVFAKVLTGERPEPIELPDDRPSILIIGYDTLPAWVNTLVKLRPVSVVFDEIHLLKSHKRWKAEVGDDAAKVSFSLLDNRSAAAYRLARVARRRLGTTATPVTDRVRDLWAELDLIHPGEWGPYWKWAQRYAGATENRFGGMDDRGKSNLVELKRRIELVRHRVSYSVANRSLPPKRRLVTYVSIAEQCRAEGGIGKEIKRAARHGPTALLEARIMEAASRKRGVVLAHARDALEAGQKVTIFTGRRVDCERLKKDAQGWGPEAISGLSLFSGHGGDSPEAREKTRLAYMEAPGPALLIGTGDAWGECLAPDTMILGCNRPLIDCHTGDMVIGESSIQKCDDVKSHDYSGTMIEIKAQGLLPLRVTRGHAVLTIAGGIASGRDRHFIFRGEQTWKNAEGVIPWNPSPRSPVHAYGDFLLVPRLTGKFANVQFDLNRYVARKQDVAARLARGCPATVCLNTGLAWIMGLYAAQGSATDQLNNGGCRTTFAIDAKKHHLADRVVEILRSLGFGVRIRVQKTWLHVVAGAGPLARMLRELMGKGAVNKRIPDEVLFNVDLSILRSFLDGYASGDAHTTENGRKVQAATVSKVLALQLQLALARFGRLAGICPQKPQPHCIDGRAILSRSFYLITWRWENRRHERFKVLDRYIATPVKHVRAWEHHGLVASMTTTGGTMLASNAVVHNGLDLQDTDLAILAMLPYTPGRLIQYEGRFARLGQKRPVLIRYFIAEGTVDEHVASILLGKLPAVERIIDSDEVTGLGRELIGISEEELLASLVEKVIGGVG